MTDYQIWRYASIYRVVGEALFILFPLLRNSEGTVPTPCVVPLADSPSQKGESQEEHSLARITDQPKCMTAIPDNDALVATMSMAPIKNGQTVRALS